MRKLNAACGLLAIGVMLVEGEAPAHASDEPPPVVARTDAPKPADPVRWSVAGSIGPIFLVRQPGAPAWPPTYLGTGWSPVTAWQLEVLRRRDDRRMILGGGLEGTYGDSETLGPQLLGAHAFAGGDWRYGILRLEATLGAGLEAAEVNVPFHLPVDSSRNGAYVGGAYESYHLGVYGQGALAAAVSVSDSIDLLLQFAVHFTVSRDESYFGASLIGVRYRLP